MFPDIRENTWTGVREFVDAAEAVLQEIGTEQERGNVTEYPNERTIRYYLSEGLIPQPEDKKGTASVFGYRHMLALLVVKKLQSKGLSNHVIRDLVTGTSYSEMERLLGEEIRVKTVTDPDEITLFSAMSQAELNEEFGEDVQLLHSVSQLPSEPKNEAADYLKGLLFARAGTDARDEPSVPLASPTPSSSPRMPIFRSKRERSWTRLEIARGLELHIREDLFLPNGRIGAKVKSLLENFTRNSEIFGNKQDKKQPRRK